MIVAGGMENMSRAPFLLPGAREGWKFGPQTGARLDAARRLVVRVRGYGDGGRGRLHRREPAVTAHDQDAFAVESHRRASSAGGKDLNDEIVPIAVPGRKGETIVCATKAREPILDRCLGELRRRSALRHRDGRQCLADQRRRGSGGRGDERTAAKTSPIKARIVATATSGVAPKEIFIAPVTAIEKVLAKAKMTLADIDLVELNEAFAAQCLACMRPLGLDPAKTNVNGGAIAMGHPIGASGARVLVTLLHVLAARAEARPGRALPGGRQCRGDDRRAGLGQAAA